MIAVLAALAAAARPLLTAARDFLRVAPLARALGVDFRGLPAGGLPARPEAEARGGRHAELAGPGRGQQRRKAARAAEGGVQRTERRGFYRYRGERGLRPTRAAAGRG